MISKIRRIQAVTAATAPAATTTTAPATAVATTPATTPAATTAAAPAATPAASSKTGSGGSFPKCAASTFVGGSSVTKNRSNDSDYCSYTPNTTCCSSDSFDNMQKWWESKDASATESRSERYHRRLQEVIKYTRHLLNWHTLILEHADAQQATQGASDYCTTAARNFKKLALAKNAPSTYGSLATKCVKYLTTWTNTMVASTCDTVGSTWFDTKTKKVTLTVENSAAAGAACADLVHLQLTSIYPYIDAVTPLVRCDAGQVKSSRPQYSRGPCAIQQTDVNTCRGKSTAVAATSPTGKEICPNLAKTATKSGSSTVSVKVTSKTRILAQRKEKKRRMQAVTTAAAPAATTTTAPAATTAATTAAAPVATTAATKCVNFAIGLLNMATFKEVICALGDTDFIRGVYMNTLHAKSWYASEKFNEFMNADNAAQVRADANVLRTQAQAKATPNTSAASRLRNLQAKPAKASGDDAAAKKGDDTISNFTVAYDTKGFNIGASFNKNKLKQMEYKNLEEDIDNTIYCGFGNLLRNFSAGAMILFTVLFC